MGADRAPATQTRTARPTADPRAAVWVVAGLSVVGGVALALPWVAEMVRHGMQPIHLIAGGVGLLALIGQGVLIRRLLPTLGNLGRLGRAVRCWSDHEPDLEALRLTRDADATTTAWNGVVDQLAQARQTLATTAAFDQLNQQLPESSDTAGTLDALPQGVIIINAEQKIASANGAASRMLMRSRERLVGAPLDKIVDDPKLQVLIEQVLTTPETRGGSIEFTFTFDEDQQAILRATVRPVGKNAQHRSALVVFEDLTQQRTADQSRNLFVAQATHELRTPLTNIGLYLERVIDLEENETADRAECLNVINQEVLRLGRVVEEVLSVSEIEAGSLKVRNDDVRIPELMQKLEDEYHQQAESKALVVSFELPPKLPVVQGDREKITLAMHNLLGNALKYTPAGGEVRVEVLELGPDLIINVTDTGIGIGEKDQAKVFDKFYRADDDRLRDIDGSGLGLALAREVIRLHGGDITLQSTLNHGSTFTLRLPINAAVPSAPAPGN